MPLRYWSSLSGEGDHITFVTNANASTVAAAAFRSFADPYFYITLRWAAGAKVDLSGLDHLAAYKARMDADAGVQAALKAEGLA